MLEWKWTYFDVLERERDKQCSVILDNTAVEGQVESRNDERRDGPVFLVGNDRRKVFDMNA